MTLTAAQQRAAVAKPNTAASQAMVPGQQARGTDRERDASGFTNHLAWFLAGAQCEILVQENGRVGGMTGRGWVRAGW